MGLSEEFKKTKKALVLPSTYTVIDAYFKGLDDQQQKDISELVEDLMTIPGEATTLNKVKFLVMDLIKKWESKL